MQTKKMQSVIQCRQIKEKHFAMLFTNALVNTEWFLGHERVLGMFLYCIYVYGVIVVIYNFMCLINLMSKLSFPEKIISY